MAIGTYTEVKNALRNWSERQDLSDTVLNEIIFLTENDCSSRLRVPAMEVKVTLAVTSEGALLIPSDYMELRRMEYEDQVLQYLPWDQFQEKQQEQNLCTLWFSRQGGKWFPSAALEEGDEVTVYYYRIIPTISEDNPVNWLLQVSPQAYLYGGLMYAYDYLMQTERSTYWSSKFMAEIDKIQAMGDMSEHRGSILAVRPI